MDSKKTWLTIIVAFFIILFIIVTFKFKLYDEMGFYAFLGIIAAVGLMYVFSLRGFNPKNNALENAAVIEQVNKLLMATPGGHVLDWNGGANCKMGCKDYRQNGVSKRYWAVITKSKEGRWFRNILDETDGVLAEIDGSLATGDLQNLFEGFEPFKNDEADMFKKMMMQGGFGRKTKRRTMRLTPGTGGDYDGEFRDNVPGEVEK